MASITLKNIPEPLHRYYKKQALTHARSLQSEILEALRRQAQLAEDTRVEPATLQEVSGILHSAIAHPLSDSEIRQRLDHDMAQQWKSAQ